MTAPFRSNFRLGKKPPKVDSRTLQLRKYLRPRLLPAPLAEDDHYSRITKWGMLGNDVRGDCVLASSAHHILGMTTYADKPWCPTEAQVIQLYDRMSPHDDGLSILDTLNVWRQTGLWGDVITAFLQGATGDSAEYKQGLRLFGGIKMGLALPDDNIYGPWTRVSGPPSPYNGHDVVGLGYDATYIYVISWGAVMKMTYDFFRAYNDEWYIVLSQDFISSGGLTHEGFNWDNLQADFKEITGSPLPPPPPSPGPSCAQRLFGTRLSGRLARWVN